jgi:hypothetical protein
VVSSHERPVEIIAAHDRASRPAFSDETRLAEAFRLEHRGRLPSAIARTPHAVVKRESWARRWHASCTTTPALA